MSILTTSPNSASSVSESTPTETDIATTDTETVDSYDGTDCPSVKWLISLTTSTKHESIECHAIQNFLSNVDFTLSNDIGDLVDVVINCVVNAGNTIDLEIQNNELETVSVCVHRFS